MYVAGGWIFWNYVYVCVYVMYVCMYVLQEYIDKFGAKNILVATNVYYILSKFINAKSTDEFYLQVT